MDDCVSIKAWILSENLLNEFIEDSSESGVAPHRGINAILKSLLEYGFSWRDNIQIILTNDIGQVTSEFDEDYQKYLDAKACHEPASWDDENEEA